MTRSLGTGHWALGTGHLEGLSDPELRAHLAVALLQVGAAREIPVQLESQEIERQAVANGRQPVHQPAALDKCVRLSFELRAADVEEQISSNVAEKKNRGRQDVDQRE